VIISVGVLALGNLLNFESDLFYWTIIMIAFVLIFIIFSFASIRSNKNEIKKAKNELGKIKKDLNISERLFKIEAYVEIMKIDKRGEVDWLLYITISAVIILGYFLLSALGLVG